MIICNFFCWFCGFLVHYWGSSQGMFSRDRACGVFTQDRIVFLNFQVASELQTIKSRTFDKILIFAQKHRLATWFPSKPFCSGKTTNRKYDQNTNVYSYLFKEEFIDFVEVIGIVTAVINWAVNHNDIFLVLCGLTLIEIALKINSFFHSS